MSRLLVSVDLPGRTLRRTVDADPVDVAVVAPIAQRAVADLAATLGRHPDDVAALIAVTIIEHEADEAAYRRVCERRGVLPL